MMHAIHTKTLAPTNTKGTRIRVRYFNTTITVPWDYALSSAENHRNAALQLADKLDRGYPLAHLFSAKLPDGSWAHIIL